MRHRKAGRKLGRNSSHRIALRRNLVRSLFQNERIVTTHEKAKEYSPFAEKMITLAKGKSLANYRKALELLPDKETVKKLFEEIGPRYISRNGGYTRVIRLAKNRLGDNASQAILELVKDEEAPKEEKKGKKSKAKKTKGKAKASPKKKTEEKKEAKPASKEEAVKEVPEEAVEEAPPKEKEGESPEETKENPE